jgi:hypothetical protein
MWAVMGFLLAAVIGACHGPPWLSSE